MENTSVTEQYADRTRPIDMRRFDEQLMAREGLRQQGRRGQRPIHENRFGLTAPEMEVVLGVLRADTNRKIATRLSMTPHTVKHHLADIFGKLGVSTRLQLAVFAVRNRLMPDAVVVEELALAMAGRGTTAPLGPTALSVVCFRGCKFRNPDFDRVDVTALSPVSSSF
jgi:DNA-binding CsgD family transcriptional regulator